MTGRDTLRRDLLVLAGILLLAALLRLPGIDGRGTWEDDQGQQALAVQQWATTGIAPLLGPPSSIGDVHHGVVTYWLFLPAALVSGGDPTAITVALALAGMAGIAATWGLARTVGGSAAGHAAALLAALSPSWIETSTFIWNANLVGPAAAIALLGAWRAWETGRARWWAVAGIATAVLVGAHLLGTVLVPPLAVLAAADLRRRRGAGRRRMLAALAAAAGVLALTLIPLVIHELTRDAGETRAFLAYLSGRLAGTVDAAGTSQPLLARIGLVAWRIASWPVTGVITAAPAMSAAATVALALLLGWRAAAAARPERAFIHWTIGTLAWSVVALAVVAPSLAVVVPGLPNDHYHAFLDPLVLTTIGLAAAAWWRMPAGGGRAARSVGPATVTHLPTAGAPSARQATPGRVIATIAVAATVVAGVPAIPPPTAPDGGWPLARDAAARIIAAAAADPGRAGRPIAVVPVADFKSADGVRFPLAYLGADVAGLRLDDPAARDPATELDGAGTLVLVCDPLFSDIVGRACDGDAEDARLAELATTGPWILRERFAAGPRRTISVYGRS